MKKIITHNGTFHPDDVSALAVFKIVFGNDVLFVRTRDEKEFEDADFVVDVGKKYDNIKYFDHHQTEGAGKRQNGIPYASFGLVWEKFGEQVAGSLRIKEIIDQKIVQSVDAGDNGVSVYSEVFPGVSPFTYSSVIASFNQTALETDVQDEYFLKAIDFAVFVIRRAIAFERVSEEAEREFKETYSLAQDKRVIVFDKDLNWKFFLGSSAVLAYPEVLYIIYPNEDKWSAQALRVNPKEFETKKPFPSLWAGLSYEELSRVSSVPGAVFCHRNCFLVVAETKEAIKALVEKAISL